MKSLILGGLDLMNILIAGSEYITAKVQESVMRNRCGGLPVSASACISGAFPLFFLLFSA
jgi:hypothetical protein